MFGFSKSTAQFLDRLAKRERGKSIRTNQPRYSHPVNQPASNGAGMFAPIIPGLSFFIVVPDTTINAALISGSQLIMGNGTAKLVQRIGTEEDSQDPTAPEPNNVASTHSDIDGTGAVAVRVFNPMFTAAFAGHPCPAFQDNFGDLYLIVYPTLFRGKSTTPIDKGGSGTVSRYVTGSNSPHDPPITDTVFNNWSDIGSDKDVAYMVSGNLAYIVTAECPLI